MKRTKRRRRRTEAEILRLVAEYESGSQSRAEFCASHGLAVPTLDSYRRRYRPTETGLVEIDIRGASARSRENSGVAIVLRNSRRVEIGWDELAHVPDHSQSLRALFAVLEEV
jgi:transposase-like protein